MDEAILSLVVFAACIILFVWDRLPMATTAILGCVAMVVLGVCDFKTAFGQFSSSTVLLTTGVMIIGSAFSATGLAGAIGNWIIQVAKGSEKKLIAGTYLVSAGLSAFLTNSAVLAIFIPIILGVSRSGSRLKAKNLIMPIAYGCVLGGASTLVGSTPQMTAQGLLEEAGIRMFKIFDFTPVVGVILLLGLIWCLTIGYRLGEKIWGSREEEILAPRESDSEIPASKGKMGIMAAIFAGTVVLYITEWLPLAVTSTAASLLCVITGCISQKQAFLEVDWNLVGRLAACLGLAKALEASGGIELITEVFRNAVGSRVSPFLLYCLLVFLVQFVSNIISNSTAILIILPIVFAIAPEMGLNAYTFALGITIGANIPLSCPLASSTLGMSMSVGYRFNDYFRYSIAFEGITYLTNITLIPLLYGLTV